MKLTSYYLSISGEQNNWANEDIIPDKRYWDQHYVKDTKAHEILSEMVAFLQRFSINDAFKIKNR